MADKEPTFKSLIKAVERAYTIACKLEAKARNNYECSNNDEMRLLDLQDAEAERVRLHRILFSLKRQYE